jgi:hypothetical protein
VAIDRRIRRDHDMWGYSGGSNSVSCGQARTCALRFILCTRTATSWRLAHDESATNRPGGNGGSGGLKCRGEDTRHKG